MKFQKINYIHNLGAYINMLQTKNKSIETIYFSMILSMDPLTAELGDQGVVYKFFMASIPLKRGLYPFQCQMYN